MTRFLFSIFIIFGGWFLFQNYPQLNFLESDRVFASNDHMKPIRVVFEDDAIVFDVMTDARTVQEFLNEQKVSLGIEDKIFPQVESLLYDGQRVRILRAKHISVIVGGEKKQITTYQVDTQKMLLENNIILDEDDLILPKSEGSVTDGLKISVVRVTIEEKVIDKNIRYKEIVNEDKSLSWRKKVVTQKGEDGVRRFTYKVASYDGKEVDRKLISQEVIKKPVDEVVTQGTYVATGKAHTGLGTWYAFTGTMAAASPWLPMGSYVKVTNQENGKTVIVKINDRGPFGKNRILDLDKVAFAEIASLGAGVINLKVEEITN